MQNHCFFDVFLNIPISYREPFLGTILAAYGSVLTSLGLNLAAPGLLFRPTWRLWGSILGFLGASWAPLLTFWLQLKPLGPNFGRPRRHLGPT